MCGEPLPYGRARRKQSVRTPTTAMFSFGFVISSSLPFNNMGLQHEFVREADREPETFRLSVVTKQQRSSELHSCTTRKSSQQRHCVLDLHGSEIYVGLNKQRHPAHALDLIV